MTTQCKPTQLEFHGLGRREVSARFDGGRISSDGGGILLREVEKRSGIIKRFVDCFTDYRDPGLIEHSLYSLIAQRVYALALGYEDLNDHDRLRNDPLLAVLAENHDPNGSNRPRRRDRGKALAGKSTLNRLELTPPDADNKSRYKKILADASTIDKALVDIFIAAHAKPPRRIVLDADATDDPLHGQQEGRFFHGYYRHYCYMPLYIFCGEHLLCARLRPSNIDAAAGTVDELERIVGQIRRHWPEVEIVVRGDSGFCRDQIMTWCEDHEVKYVLGLAKNQRLLRRIEAQMGQAKAQFEQSGEAQRCFKDFTYQTQKSWSCQRRVVAKAEHLAKGANPRFIVSNLKRKEFEARALYEDFYCARGEMENRIKEQQLSLFADRTSTHFLRTNQLRLYFSSIAYVLMHALRRLGLQGTQMAKAQCATIRTKLLKIGAVIKISVRKVWISMSESYPYATLFNQIYQRLANAP